MNTVSSPSVRPFARLVVIAILVFAGVTGILFPTSARSQIPTPTRIYVDANVVAGGLGDGSSWANAFASLDSAIAAALPTGEIWVAQGMYKPSTQATGFVITKSLKLYGGFVGPHPAGTAGEATLQERHGSFKLTVLEGDLASDDLTAFSYTDNAVHVVKIDGSAGSVHVVLDGFEIENGYCVTFLTFPANDGAGVYCESADLDVANCYFDKDRARNGGGIWFTGATMAPPVQGAYIGNKLTVKCSEFLDNRADQDGGAIFGEKLTTGWVVNSKFLSNKATLKGGGVYLRRVKATGSVDFTNSVFWENTGHGFYGAGIYMDEASSSADDTTITSVVNCTFAGNNSVSVGCGDGQAVLVSPHSQGRIRNSILWYNHDLEFGLCSNQGNPITGPATVTYSDVEFGWTATSPNISVEPKFSVGMPTHGALPDLTLKRSGGTTRGSDCIDYADYDQLPFDVADLDDDGDTSERMPVDLSDSPRMVDRHGYLEDNLGVPSGSDYLDMGAYERP